MVAVVRHEDAGLLGGLDDGRALGHTHRCTVDDYVDEFVCHAFSRCLESGPYTAANAGSRAPWIYASNSWRNFWIPLTIGAAQESLSTQMVLPVMLSDRSSNSWKCSCFPLPARMRSRILTDQAVPSRHWVHWAQDSWA